MTSLVGGVVACVVAAAFSPLVLRVIRGRIMDIPNERSSHEQPTPRGGGLVIVIGVGAGLGTTQVFASPVVASFLVALAFGLVGLVEDLRGVPVLVRLVLQVSIAVSGLRWVGAEWSEGGWWLILMAGVALVWVVGYTNAFNFMDGINGISAAQLIVAGTTWTITGEVLGISEVSVFGAVTAGASLGFLPWNFPKARFFMGDVGSYFSGCWLALVAIVGVRLGIPPIVMAAPMLIYLADTTFTLGIRIARGEAWLMAHRSHVYQRLVVGGWSHLQTTAFFAVAASVVAASSLLWLLESGLAHLAGIVGILLGLAGYFAPLAVQNSSPE